MAIKKIIPREIQQVFIIGAVIFFVLLFFGGRLILKYHDAQILKIKKQRKRVELENRVANQLSKLKKIKEEITVVNESSRFLAEIAKMSGQINLKITSISAIPIEKRDEFIKLGVNLELDTTYHEVGVFMSKLEASEIFVTVEKLEMVPVFGKENPQAPRINAKISLSTFVLTDTVLEK
ncbi:MAG: type 4a pilus biogenesis protein PilO [Candidatus Omnitrophica bacterium]|nr:type 4a pilus biogenesis protein PilO [Candidatus Omnitrophota bacterium]